MATRDPAKVPLDRRRLHGWATPGGIVFRDLSDPDREPWRDRDADAILDRDRARAQAAMDRDGILR